MYALHLRAIKTFQATRHTCARRRVRNTEHEHLTAIAPTYTNPCLTCDLYMKLTPFHAKQPKNMTLPLNRRNTCTKSQ